MTKEKEEIAKLKEEIRVLRSGGQDHRVSYCETRVISIGDFERVSSELRYTSNVKKINSVGDNERGEIKNEANSAYYNEMTEEEFFHVSKELIQRVKKVLNAREAELRLRSARYTDHDTITKALIMKIVSMTKAKKLKAMIESEGDAIDSFNDEYETPKVYQEINEDDDI